MDGLIRAEMFRSWRDRTGKGRDEAPSWCDGGWRVGPGSVGGLQSPESDELKCSVARSRWDLLTTR